MAGPGENAAAAAAALAGLTQNPADSPTITNVGGPSSRRYQGQGAAERRIRNGNPGGRFENKNLLEIIKFPLDIEQAPVPHVLIKIFETETGAEVRDDLSNLLVGGASAAIDKAKDLNLDTLAGAAAGGKLALTPAVLLALGKNYKAAAAVLAGGAAAGGAAVESGAVSATIGGLIDAAGGVLGIDNSSDRFKTIISSFALKRNIEQLKTAIAMLMPETLSVSYTNNYEALSVTEALGVAGGIAQAVGSDAGKSGDAVNPYMVELVGRAAGATITEEFKKIGLFATTGRTVNPQLEVIYNAPTLREFNMDFRLVPRNSAESTTILAIIKNLKYFAAPTIPKNTGGRYFIPPAQFELEFYDAENNQNIFLFRTKKCVLKDISVDFTGTGGFQTFYDGSPVETRLTLQFQETVFIDREAVEQGY